MGTGWWANYLQQRAAWAERYIDWLGFEFDDDVLSGEGQFFADEFEESGGVGAVREVDPGISVGAGEVGPAHKYSHN